MRACMRALNLLSLCSKPADWVDLKEIDDPDDKKPEGYDVPELIPDPASVKPAEYTTIEDDQKKEKKKRKENLKEKRKPTKSLVYEVVLQLPQVFTTFVLSWS
jgi:hypothetical protein